MRPQTASLRIGVDGRAFTSPAGGVRRYVQELYGAIAASARETTVIAFGAADDALLPAHVERHRVWSLPTNLGWMAASIPLAARRARLDVYHAPAYTAPLWGVHPQVLTIHDVSYERRPEWNAYKKDRVRRWFYRRSALAADRVVTDSRFSQSEIVAAYGIPEERIDVVPLAASATFGPGPFDPTAAPAGVHQPYALHVGDLHVRRNLATALSAMLAVRRAQRPQDAPASSSASCLLPSAFSLLPSDFSLPPSASCLLSLVCAGIDRGTGQALRAQAEEARDPGALVLTGTVSDAVLLNLYRGAAMLLYPSRYEGFGLPILEAMQCGVPVIGANAASIPELVGDAGILLDPLDAAAWADAIAQLARDPAPRARWSAAGTRRAAAFSWTRTAAETLDVLRRCASARERARS